MHGVIVCIVYLGTVVMYRLLLENQPFHGMHVSYPFIQAKNKYQESIQSAIEYYQSFPMYLSNQHILTRLLQGMSFDSKGTDFDIYKEVNSKRLRIASAYGFTSDVTPGHLHTRGFYTKNCIIRLVDYTDPMNIPEWKKIRAVRVLTHPYISLKPILPHLFRTLDKSEYSIVGIDLGLLAVQYRGWLVNEMKKPEAERKKVDDFITQIVMVGMLPEQFDIALRNRMEMIAKDKVKEEIEIKTPFYTISYDEEFDKAIIELLKFYNNGSKRLTHVLRGMPMFSEENMFDSIPRNLIGLNIMSYWTTLLVYCDWYYTMSIAFDINAEQELIRTNLLKVDRYVKGTRCDKYIPERIYEKWEEKYNTIMTMWT